jgi:sugar/nucleoside kinase (ribokinase family)
MEENKQIDFLSIGDIATEPFIKIKEAEEKCDPDGNYCKLCLDYGGKIPYESNEVCHAVGNSSNVSIALSRLGMNSYLASYVGDDVTGSDNIKQLKIENVKTDYLNVIKGLESNYHYVLWYGAERTILVRHTEFPYSFSLDTPEPKWIYLSSLASNSLDYHKTIGEYLNKHPNVSLAFQPGTFQIKFGIGPLSDIYRNTKVLFCNHEEAEKILNTKEKDIPKLIKMMHKLGPKIVVITDGENGSYSYDGDVILFMKAFYHKPIETTGAGDSFSGAFIAALFLDYSISDAMIWGAVNSSSVVSYVGPHKGLLNRKQIEEFIKDISPEDKPIILF